MRGREREKANKPGKGNKEQKTTKRENHFIIVSPSSLRIRQAGGHYNG